MRILADGLERHSYNMNVSIVSLYGIISSFFFIAQITFESVLREEFIA
jgi:hypothetical protein